MSAGLVAALAALLLAAPPRPPATSVAGLSAWLRATPPDAVITTTAALLAWVCLVWLLGGAVLIALARVPGQLGTGCAVLARWVTPRALRRTVEAALGVTLATVPMAAALPAVADSGSGARVDATTPAMPDLDRSGTGGRDVDASSAAYLVARPPVGRTGRVARTSAWPNLDRPGGGTPEPTGPDLDRPGRSARSGAGLGAEDGTDELPRASAPGTRTVLVRPGDSLWSIAERALGGSASPERIAAAWPRWYAANRSAVGSDPDSIRPGQRLHAPQ